jgi:hypothetical protein
MVVSHESVTQGMFQMHWKKEKQEFQGKCHHHLITIAKSFETSSSFLTHMRACLSLIRYFFSSLSVSYIKCVSERGNAQKREQVKKQGKDTHHDGDVMTITERKRSISPEDVIVSPEEGHKVVRMD